MTNEEMAKAAQAGSRTALTELWGAVRPLLFSLAWKFYTRQGKERCSSHGITLEDLQQETFFALCDAARDRAGQVAESLVPLARICGRAAGWPRLVPC